MLGRKRSSQSGDYAVQRRCWSKHDDVSTSECLMHKEEMLINSEVVRVQRQVDVSATTLSILKYFEITRSDLTRPKQESVCETWLYTSYW